MADSGEARGDDDGQASARVTYLLVDGENLDAVLGMSVLGRRPAPDERPRWERVLDFARRAWDQPVKPLFFINASSGELHRGFVAMLHATAYRPIPLSGPPDVKVVDVGIQRTLDAVAGRDGDVILGSHDVDFLPHVQDLLRRQRRVALLAFREFVSSAYDELEAEGLEMFDLEDDARCFNNVLPRTRIIDIDAFDPSLFL